MYYALIDSDRRIKAASLWKFEDVPDYMSMLEIEGDIPDSDYIDDFVVDANRKAVSMPIERDEPAIETMPTYAELLDAVNTLGEAVAELMDAKEGV